MKRMPAGEFKTNCLAIMDEVRDKRETVVITKHGQPVAKLVPAEQPPADVFDCLKGVIEIVGDIEEPLVPPEEWEALR